MKNAVMNGSTFFTVATNLEDSSSALFASLTLALMPLSELMALRARLAFCFGSWAAVAMV